MRGALPDKIRDKEKRWPLRGDAQRQRGGFPFQSDGTACRSQLEKSFTTTRMSKYYVIFAGVVACASAAIVMDSNVFMDSVLQQKMPSLVRGNTKLYPFAPIPDFHFKIKSTGLLNRDLKVNITEGAVRHLDTAPHRIGNCKPPVLVGGKTVVSCDLDLKGVNTTFVAKTKGDNLVGTVKSIWVQVNATRALADFEAAALPGKDASVETFRIRELELKTKYDKALSLSDDRKKDFRKEVEKKVQTALYEIIYNEYKRVLERAVADTYFPRA